MPRCIWQVAGQRIGQSVDTLKGQPVVLIRNQEQESAKAILGIMGVRIDIDKIREIKEKEEVYNVCKAFDDHLERGRREGRREGKREGMQEALKNLMENLQVSLEQAMELLGIPLEDRDKYFPLG